MKNLKWLSLNRSKVSTLPEDLEKFPKLEILSACRNEVKELYSCNIPSCANLRVLSAHHNNLRESGIPSDLFSLEHLVTVDFSHNEFSRLPECLTNVKRLLVLNLSHNRFTQIPGALFVHCHDLFYLDLSNNEITALPPQLRRLEHLQTLILANNPLQHYVFKNIDKLKSLTTLNLSNTGRDLTNTHNLHMLGNLTDVDFSHNNLPRVPDGLLMLESLRRVNVSHNQIKELSSLVGSWTELVTLNVSYNRLTSLPNDICQCVKLRKLFFNDNMLTFEGLPTNIGKLVNLEHFIAPRNHLECIPEGFARCYKLKRLILSSNKLLTLPEGLYFLTELKEITTDDNPDLVMPPKPSDDVSGSGAEFYNIDFDSERLKAGAVVSQSKPVPRSFTSRLERNLRLARRRTTSVENDDAADKVLKGLVRVADTKHQREVQMIQEEAEPEVDNIKARSWREALKRPDLNYKDLFPGDPGKITGVSVWQIENFYPVQVDEKFHGKLYTGDCYIVLRTFFNEKSNIDWQIWYWIGSESTIDKKTCVAMHAIHLRNMLEAPCSTIREEQGDESPEFLEVFNNDVQFIEGGTASGFYSVEEEAPLIRMYRIHQMKTLHLEPVLPDPESLDQGLVFLLDAGKEIFVWQGTKSSLNARSKARLVAEKINKTERKNQAVVTSFKHVRFSFVFLVGCTILSWQLENTFNSDIIHLLISGLSCMYSETL
jgi:Leucine-rich repeat (LRR) protein